MTDILGQPYSFPELTYDLTLLEPLAELLRAACLSTTTKPFLLQEVEQYLFTPVETGDPSDTFAVAFHDQCVPQPGLLRYHVIAAVLPSAPPPVASTVLASLSALAPFARSSAILTLVLYRTIFSHPRMFIGMNLQPDPSSPDTPSPVPIGSPCVAALSAHDRSVTPLASITLLTRALTRGLRRICEADVDAAVDRDPRSADVVRHLLTAGFPAAAAVPSALTPAGDPVVAPTDDLPAATAEAAYWRAVADLQTAVALACPPLLCGALPPLHAPALLAASLLAAAQQEARDALAASTVGVEAPDTPPRRPVHYVKAAAAAAAAAVAVLSGRRAATAAQRRTSSYRTLRARRRAAKGVVSVRAPHPLLWPAHLGPLGCVVAAVAAACPALSTDPQRGVPAALAALPPAAWQCAGTGPAAGPPALPPAPRALPPHGAIGASASNRSPSPLHTLPSEPGAMRGPASAPGRAVWASRRSSSPDPSPPSPPRALSHSRPAPSPTGPAAASAFDSLTPRRGGGSGGSALRAARTRDLLDALRGPVCYCSAAALLAARYTRDGAPRGHSDATQPRAQPPLAVGPSATATAYTDVFRVRDPRAAAPAGRAVCQQMLATGASGHARYRALVEVVLSSLADALLAPRGEAAALATLWVVAASPRLLSMARPTTRERLLLGAYAQCTPGHPCFPTRTVRRAASAALDVLQPAGRRTRKVMNFFFRVFHQSMFSIAKSVLLQTLRRLATLIGWIAFAIPYVWDVMRAFLMTVDPGERKTSRRQLSGSGM